MNHRVINNVLIFIVSQLIGLLLTSASYGAIIINAPMTDTNSTGWTLGGGSVLTGDGTTDPVGQGWLRLTNNATNQAGYAYNNTSFDLSQGALIQFDYATWGGTGADGYAIYLFDAGVGTFNIGASGGSLGYAQKTGIAGISGGYMGIGVDEYGNFSAPTEGRYLGPGANPNTVTVRGSVVGFGGGAIGQTTNANSYPWIATSANNGALWYNGTPRPGQTSANYRKVIIEISPAPNPVVNVWVQFGYNTAPIQMITNAALPAIATTQLLKIGYAASTGGSTNYHEIRNLLVTTQNATTAIDLGIAKSVLDTTTSSTTTAAVGDGIRYTLVTRNYGPNNVTATGVGIVDTIPANITGVTWTCAAAGGATCGAASGSGNSLNTTASLPLNGTVTYTINGTIGAPAPTQLSNTASLVIPGSVTDYFPTDDSATAAITVTSNLSTSTKSFVDLNGGDQNPNDVLQFTITLNESSGAVATGVSVTDTLPATLTNLTVISYPAGATNSSTATQLNITGISVPASGSASIVFQATIANGTAVGTLINNTATVTNPNGTGATPSSPTITVSASQVATTGNKPLYLYDSTSTPAYKLSRTPMAVNAASFVTIPRGNTLQSWTLSPVLQLSDTIKSGTVPVQLWLATNSARTYSMPVTLRCGATAVATLTQNAALTATVTLFTFNLPLATTSTCAAGSSWALDITNTQAAGGGARDIRVYPSPAAGNYSNVSLPSNNVINVNSVNDYSAAYPSVTTPPTGYYGGGQTVYVRAVVSDPFGSFDITSAAVTIKDPSNSVVVNAAAMTLVNDSGTATKTYEYAFTVPAAGPAGFWTASVTAKEGTENTVTHTASDAFQVVLLPSLIVVKSASPSPAVNPGQVVTYSAVVTNTGLGVATTVVLTDVLPRYTSWGINSYGAGVAFQFVNGAPASGLSLGTPAYSQDNGTTWTYVPVSGGGGAPAGYDRNVTNWRIPMTGTMNANGANFTINYKVSVN